MATKTKYDTLDKTTFDNLLEGYQLISPEWKYIYVNHAVVKHSRYSKKEDLLGYTMMEKYPGIEKTELFKVLKECMNSRVSRKMTNEFMYPDQSKGWFELCIEPVPQGLFILSIDITERIKAEQAKKEYIESLEEMMSITSHGVRQPLCNIKGIMNLLDRSDLSREELRKLTEYLPEAVETLDILTIQLMEFMQDKKIKLNKDHYQE